MIVGFTGTRENLTDVQLGWLYTTLESDKTITAIHHGACQGADAAAHQGALDNEIPVHVWPPTNPKYVATQCLIAHQLVTIHHAMPYLNRDREIVRATDGLIALPKHDKQPDRAYWGGTWYTVDFAERLSKPVVICYPNGGIEIRNPNTKGHNRI
jgi:hypothetical protein